MAGANIVCALLAAGDGNRFGGNKLETMLGERMLGTVAAATLSTARIGPCLAITSAGTPVLTAWLQTRGFAIITNHDPGAGLSQSLALAAAAAIERDADALLICLADMPFVPVDHFHHLISAFTQHSLASTDGNTKMPPALFPRALLRVLTTLTGDSGARDLLKQATPIYVSSAALFDVDTQGDLAQAKRMIAAK